MAEAGTEANVLDTKLLTKKTLSSLNELCRDHMNVAAGNFCLPLLGSPRRLLGTG